MISKKEKEISSIICIYCLYQGISQGLHLFPGWRNRKQLLGSRSTGAVQCLGLWHTSPQPLQRAGNVLDGFTNLGRPQASWQTTGIEQVLALNKMISNFIWITSVSQSCGTPERGSDLDPLLPWAIKWNKSHLQERHQHIDNHQTKKKKKEKKSVVSDSTNICKDNLCAKTPSRKIKIKRINRQWRLCRYINIFHANCWCQTQWDTETSLAFITFAEDLLEVCETENGFGYAPRYENWQGRKHQIPEDWGNEWHSVGWCKALSAR